MRCCLPGPCVCVLGLRAIVRRGVTWAEIEARMNGWRSLICAQETERDAAPLIWQAGVEFRFLRSRMPDGWAYR